MRKKYVTLLVEWDETEYDNPENWNWTEMVGDTIIVHSHAEHEENQ